MSSYIITAISIYLNLDIHILAMTEYEWEVGRVPRSPKRGLLWDIRRRSRSITEYGSLEYPQESEAWVLHAHRGEETPVTVPKRIEDGPKVPPGRIKRSNQSTHEGSLAPSVQGRASSPRVCRSCGRPMTEAGALCDDCSFATLMIPVL